MSYFLVHSKIAPQVIEAFHNLEFEGSFTARGKDWRAATVTTPLHKNQATQVEIFQRFRNLNLIRIEPLPSTIDSVVREPSSLLKACEKCRCSVELSKNQILNLCLLISIKGLVFERKRFALHV